MATKPIQPLDDDDEPDELPVEPDEGLSPSGIPDDPEFDRIVNLPD